MNAPQNPSELPPALVAFAHRFVDAVNDEKNSYYTAESVRKFAPDCPADYSARLIHKLLRSNRNDIPHFVPTLV